MDGKQEKPAFSGKAGFGEAREANMNPKEEQKVRESVGLSPEEVKELNQPKPGREAMTGTHLVKKAVNVVAAGLTAAAGTGLAGTAQEALNSTPAPIVREQKPDPKRDNPPEGVVFKNQVLPIRQAQGKQVEQVKKSRADALFDSTQGRYFLFQG